MYAYCMQASKIQMPRMYLAGCFFPCICALENRHDVGQEMAKMHEAFVKDLVDTTALYVSRDALDCLCTAYG